VHAGIKLYAQYQTLTGYMLPESSETNHYCLSLILYNVTRPSNLIAATETEEEQFVRGIDGLLFFGRHGRMLALSGHCEFAVDVGSLYYV